MKGVSRRKVLFSAKDKYEKNAIAPIFQELERRGFDCYWVIQEWGQTAQTWSQEQGIPEFAITCRHPDPTGITDLLNLHPKFLFWFAHDLVMLDETDPVFTYFTALFLPNYEWYNIMRSFIPRQYLHVTGWVPSDILFSPDYNSRYKDFSAKYKLKELPNQKTALFTPSWLHSHKVLATIVSLIKGSHINVLVKGVPGADPALMQRLYEVVHINKNARWIDPAENFFDVVPFGDVLISDQSSTLLEFMITGKPSVSYQADFPGVYKTSLEELGDVVKNVLARDSNVSSARHKEFCRKHYINGQWGKATVNSVEIILSIINSSTKKGVFEKNPEYDLNSPSMWWPRCLRVVYRWKRMLFYYLGKLLPPRFKKALATRILKRKMVIHKWPPLKD